MISTRGMVLLAFLSGALVGGALVPIFWVVDYQGWLRSMLTPSQPFATIAAAALALGAGWLVLQSSRLAAAERERTRMLQWLACAERVAGEADLFAGDLEAAAMAMKEVADTDDPDALRAHMTLGSVRGKPLTKNWQRDIPPDPEMIRSAVEWRRTLALLKKLERDSEESWVTISNARKWARFRNFRKAAEQCLTAARRLGGGAEAYAGREWARVEQQGPVGLIGRLATPPARAGSPAVGRD